MPDCAASVARPHDVACGFESFADMLCAYGDLGDESDVEAAQRERFATLDELKSMSASYASTAAATQRRRRSHYAECNAVPEPVWRVDDSRATLQMHDATSRFALPLPVDIAAPRRPGDSLRSEQRRWASELLQSSRGALRNRWIYFMGDSTMRQHYGFLLNELHRQSRMQRTQASHTTISFDKLKAITRGQLRYTEGPNATVSMCRSLRQPMHWEYRYPGPVYGDNEMTTTFRLPTANLTLTFDWKMHIFRRYDRWLVARRFSQGAPDVLVVSAGMHDCFWNESRALGAEYHKEETRVLLAFLAASLPRSTALLWVSTQVSIGPFSGDTLPIVDRADDNEARRRYSAFFRGDTAARLRCVRAVNQAAATASREEGWFAYVDRERMTHALASFALHGHPPPDCADRGCADDFESSGPWWFPNGSDTTANTRARLLTRDGVHYSEDNNVFATLDHYLRSALGCVLSRM